MKPLEIGPWPTFSSDCIRAATSVLTSGKVNYWTGTETRLFEREFADWTGRAHCVALANGTVALELALEALGVGKGHEVVVPPRTFVATALAVLRVGATPVFADIDRESGALRAETIERVITPRTRAIIPVHLGGFPAPMPEIMELARNRGLRVVEDCAQAHGAISSGRKVGTWGDIGAFSFCQDKILTTAGEGGCVVTDDDDLYRRIWSLKDHGKGYETVHRPVEGDAFRWLHENNGSNQRMSELHAAVGRVALGSLDAWLEERESNAMRLYQVLSQSDLRVPLPAPDSRSAFYRLYAYVRPEQTPNRETLFERFRRLGLPARSGSCSEIYREKVFRDAGLGPEQPLAVAAELAETAIEFPTHPGVTPVINEFCERLGRALSEPS